MRPGNELRSLRAKQGLTLRDVHSLSERIAEELGNPEYRIFSSRLHEFETRDVRPSIHRLYSLATIYRCRLREILSLYGIPPT